MSLPKAFPDNNVVTNLKKFQASPVLYMEEAAREYGSPVDLNLPMGDFVLISDPEQAHHVLATNHENYEKSKGYKEIARVLGNGLLTAEGSEWRKQRKALQPSFHKTALRELVPAIWDTGAQYLQGLLEKQTIRLDTEMSNLTLTVLLNSLIEYQDEALKKSMSSHIMFGQEFIVNRIRNPFKLPVWIPTAENRRYHHMMKDIDRIVQQCIADRRQVEYKDVEDLLTVLLENHNSVQEFARIRDELITFLVAGHETSALGLTWTLHLVAHHQEVQERLYQEVKNIGKLEDIDLLNFSNLTYTQQVIKESMRLYPPIWNIVRRAKEADTVGGYEIPKHKQLMLNIYLIHRNSQYWKKPSLFNPERFAADAPEFGHKYQYIPFGGGPRFCIGNNFALYEMTVLLVQFIRDFHLAPKSVEFPGFNPLLTLRPDRPIEVVAKRRG